MLVLTGCAGDPAGELTPVPVRQGRFVVDVEAKGVVQPLDSHAIAAPGGVWGSIEALAPEGRPVKKGDFLARISVRNTEEEYIDLQEDLAREERKLKRLKAEAPVKRWEIDQEILDKERAWRMADLGHQQALRGGRRDERQAARRDLTVAAIKLESDAIAEKRALYEKGVLSRLELEKAELAHAQAELARKRAKLALALLEPGARAEEVDKARYGAEIAKAAYEGVRIEAPAKGSLLELDQERSQTRARRLKMRVRKLKERVESAVLTAPADGLVLYPLIWNWKKVHVGMEVWQGLNFLEVARLDRVKILGTVSEQAIAKVREGAKVEITADGHPGRVFAARVHKVSQLAKEEEGAQGTFGVKRFDVEVRPTANTPELRPNMRVRLRIVFAERAEATAVPADALFGAERAQHVWLATARGPEKRAVKPELFGTDWVALAEPLPKDARVYLLDPHGFAEAAASEEVQP